jgi:hypothetical protein
MSNVTIMEAMPCEDVCDFAIRMIQRAKVDGSTVLGEFNQYTLEASPSSSQADVLKPFDEHQRRSYFVGDR